MKVNFNRISVSGNELPNIQKAIESGHLQGDGAFTKICEKALREITKAPAALLTTSGTSSLDMAALLLDLKEGDEFIVPTYTFVSSVNSFVLRGAKPVFCDINPDTLNIDETKIESLVTDRTKLIVPVHYAGVGCEIEKIADMTAIDQFFLNKLQNIVAEEAILRENPGDIRIKPFCDPFQLFHALRAQHDRCFQILAALQMRRDAELRQKLFRFSLKQSAVPSVHIRRSVRKYNLQILVVFYHLGKMINMRLTTFGDRYPHQTHMTSPLIKIILHFCVYNFSTYDILSENIY